ncbi:hypothetical protein HY523_02320, partial [Candidatus Berkelbacteria bacterium]|nr:hypothetical protein [Candidatus Berkelbacteria bacterium]
GSVAVAIVENSRTSQEKLLISGRPDDIGGLLLNFSPKANATYTIAVVSLQNPPTTLSEQTLDPTQTDHQIKFVIP